MRTKHVALAVVLMSVMAVGAFAQQGPRGGGQGGQGGPGGFGGGEGGGRFDPAQIQERMMERMKEQLAVGDEEWTVMKPRLQKVMELNRDVTPGNMGMRGGFGGGRGGRGGAAEALPENASAVQKASAALATTLANQEATAEELTAKLKAYREARDAAKQELATAREALREVTTLRQEAQLVMIGLLD